MTPRRPMRVLAIDHTAALGGGELAMARLLGALPADAFTVRVMLFADGPLVSRLAADGTRVEVFAIERDLGTADRTEVLRASWRSVRRFGQSLAFVMRLARRMQDLRPDVVYANSLKAGILGGLAARVARTPLVWHVRDRISPDYMPPRLVSLVRTAIRWLATVVIANSAATAATIRRPDEIVIAHSGFAPMQALDAFSDRTDRQGSPVVGLIGRISPTKGQKEFVRAARLVCDERPDTSFRIVGSPMFGAESYAAAVDAEIARLGLAGRVDIVPFVDDPITELDRLSVCVHASPVPEPFGQVVLEAMVRGVPVVATDAGGVPEILRDGTELLGELIRPGDHVAMARAVLLLLGDPDFATEQARRAFDSACRRFPVSTTAKRVSDAWRRAAGPGR